jgi:hypothetical protein
VLYLQVYHSAVRRSPVLQVKATLLNTHINTWRDKQREKKEGSEEKRGEGKNGEGKEREGEDTDS